MVDPVDQRRVSKILYVSHVADLGGAEKSLLDLVGALDRGGFRPWVVVPRRGELSASIEEVGGKVEFCWGLRRLYRSRNPLALVRMAAVLFLGMTRLFWLGLRIRPNVVHANSTTAALYCLFMRFVPGVSLVWHVRDLETPPLVARLLGWLSHRVLVPSHCVEESLAQKVESTKVARIANGVRIEDFSATELPSSQRGREDELVFLSVGQLVPWKGFDLLIEAVALVRDRVPNARFVVLGDDWFDNDKGTRARLAAQVVELNLEGRVCFEGFRSEVPAFLRRAYALVHPAFPEPFGRAIIEAMASELPVIAFDGAHGPAEILRDQGGAGRAGAAGVLVTPRSASALARAIVELAEEPGRAKSFGEAGRRRAEREYDRRVMAKGCEAVYLGFG